MSNKITLTPRGTKVVKTLKTLGEGTLLITGMIFIAYAPTFLG